MTAINSSLEQTKVSTLFQQGFLFHQQNKLQEAQVIYKQILKIQPNHFNSLHLLGVILAENHQFLQAANFLFKALQINTKDASCYTNYGNVLQELNRLNEALDSYDKALRIDHDADTYYNRGNVLRGLNRLDESLDSYDRAILHNSNFADAYSNRGLVLHDLKRFDEAVISFYKAVQIKPDFAEAYYNCSRSFKKIRRLNEALKSCEKALLINPDYVDAWIIIGEIYSQLNQSESSLLSYKKALNLDANNEVAISGVIEELDRSGRALDAISFAQEYIHIINNSDILSELMGYIYLYVGDKESSYQAFKKSCVVKIANKSPMYRSTIHGFTSKIKHEYEQLCHIASKNIKINTGSVALDLLRDNMILNLELIDDQKRQDIIDAVDSYHYIPDMAFFGKALGANNYCQIEKQYLSSKLRLVVIDNFLTDEALLNLRQFCEEANVWKRSYVNGYLGAFIGSGFCPRVLLSIADELKIALPNLIGSDRLFQAWGFKYDQEMTGINLHADFAKVNVNFWITPDDACIDMTAGGMVIYDAPVPNNWRFEEYNTEISKLKEYLELNNSKSVKVPYKMNRCVLFDSSYIHNTDKLAFKAGYQNRRINCTLLYGKQLALE